jgi:hypothetical protein
MHIPESAFEEPMSVHVRFLRRADREEHFTEHPAGIREITGLRLTTLVPLRSAASQRIFASKIPSTRTGLKPLLAKLNSTASGEIRWSTSGRIFQSFFVACLHPRQVLA